jgi:hypothetical protein
MNTYGYIIEWLANFILKVDFTPSWTRQPVQSEALELTLADETLGTVAGNRVTFATAQTAKIVVGPGRDVWNWVNSRSGTVSDVEQSSGFALWASAQHDHRPRT